MNAPEPTVVYVDPDTGEVIKPQALELAREHRRAEAKEKRENRNSPYKKWAQMNLETDAIRTLVHECSVGADIFFWLVRNMDGHNAIVVSTAALCDAINRSKPTVVKGIKYLREHNYVGIGKVGTTNVYYINADIVWKSWGHNKRYAKLVGNIILSEKEQTKRLEVVRTNQVIMPADE